MYAILVSNYPRALVLAVLLLACLPSTADAGGLVLIRDVQSGRLKQVWAEPVRSAVVPSEPTRRSPAFDRIWASYAGPVGRISRPSIEGHAVPRTYSPPVAKTIVNPYF